MVILSEHWGKISSDCVTHSMKSDVHDAGGQRWERKLLSTLREPFLECIASLDAMGT